MKQLRAAAAIVACALVLISVIGSIMPRFNYVRQDREHVNCSASQRHWLGTDDLGRDRFARLLHGSCVSILLAPAAAAISIILAFAMGAIPGFAGGFGERAAKIAIDLVLSIPWLFLLLMVRAMLPLNTSPATSVSITFLVLGLLGWAAPARILLARARSLRRADCIVLARSTGVTPFRLLYKQVMPNLRPALLAQFWISVPIFILSEANLSILGLGVAEPLPSLGSLLRELETVLSVRADVWRFAPLLVLVLLVSSLQIAVSGREVSL
jgi:ABC-type dipeptide/oligopeptide/nickel transport system permease subunit